MVHKVISFFSLFEDSLVRLTASVPPRSTNSFPEKGYFCLYQNRSKPSFSSFFVASSSFNTSMSFFLKRSSNILENFKPRFLPILKKSSSTVRVMFFLVIFYHLKSFLTSCIKLYPSFFTVITSKTL